jgi:uncharacterized protein YuzE
MEALKILEKSAKINWDYDEEADVLYLSINEPCPAISVDVRDGIILRYDEVNNELVGLTLIGLKSRLVNNLTKL